MSKMRKHRADGVSYKFRLFGCATYLIKLEGKFYIYEAVLMREAKKASAYTQALYSLYRDIHKTASARVVFGLRAICFDDFNKEGHLVNLEVHPEGLSEQNEVIQC